MSTRSFIGIENSDHSVDCIYCHFDGYLSGVGRILLNHYKDREKVTTLIDLGNISSLGKEIGEKHDFNECPKNVCNAYGRDREEENISATHSDNVKDFLRNIDEKYTYLFNEDDKWMCRLSRGSMHLLTQEEVAESD